jgi:hypothetical protein
MQAESQSRRDLATVSMAPALELFFVYASGQTAAQPLSFGGNIYVPRGMYASPTRPDCPVPTTPDRARANADCQFGNADTHYCS